jgi:hypothetical protein
LSAPGQSGPSSAPAAARAGTAPSPVSPIAIALAAMRVKKPRRGVATSFGCVRLSIFSSLSIERTMAASPLLAIPGRIQHAPIDIHQQGGQNLCRGVVCGPRHEGGHEATRVHHATRWRGSVGVSGPRARAVKSSRFFVQRVLRYVPRPAGRFCPRTEGYRLHRG